MDEQWKHIAGYAGRYHVSNQGRVRGASGKVLTSQPDKRGNPKVRLCEELSKGGRSCELRVDWLVAMEFIGPPPARRWIVHKDGDKSNNMLSNLDWDRRPYTPKRGRTLFP